MVIELTQDQLNRLEQCRRQFNKITGLGYSQKKYLAQAVKEMVIDQEASAQASIEFQAQVTAIAANGGLNVH